MPYKDKEAEKANRREHYLKNRERVLQQVAAYREAPGGREKTRAATRSWKERNKRAVLAQRDRESLTRPGLSREWGVKILAVIPDAGEAERVAERRRRALRASLKRAAEAHWREGADPKDVWRLRYRNDPEFALLQRLRAAMRKAAKRYTWVAWYFGSEARRQGTGKLWSAVGYTARDLREHLERQFTPGMSWERLLAGEIHIDHIVPKSSFDLDSLDEVRACFALSNLRPLWAAENMAKGSRRETLL